MKENNKSIGNDGEMMAAAFLEKQGFNIIERNYRFSKDGEIDIIAFKDNILVFAEVKTRRVPAFGGPLYSISARKKNRLRYIAKRYLSGNPQFFNKNIVCRFDLLAVENNTIRWVEDIIR